MMTSKEKMLTAIDKGLGGNFPVVVPYVDIFLRDHWNEVTDQPWWTFHNPDITSWIKVEEDLLKKLDVDWICCGLCPPREWREGHRIEEDKGLVFLVGSDHRKEKLQRDPIGGHHIAIEKEPLIRSMDDIDKYIGYLSKEYLIKSGRLDYVKLVVNKFGYEKFICTSIGTPYWTALCNYFGFKGMMMNLFRRSRLIESVLERLTEITVQILRADAESKVDGVWIEECLSSATEISLDQFRRFVLPYNEELIKEIRKLGMKSIYYPCGDVRDRLELMIDIEPDCLSVEESKKGFNIDISWVADIVSGRTCLFGNIDSIRILQNGTWDELRKEIRRQIGVGLKHKRFIISLGSPVTPLTPLSRVAEFINIARQESTLY
ncbi:MAG: uroporphyrinogen decarboxylase family protein [Thermoproteota archaeon]